MKKLPFLKLVLVLSFLIIQFSVFSQRKMLPNIVIIFMDDMGYADLGSYGAIGYKTPNLDKLAKQGMRFTNFYSAQPVCTASRAGLLTGCYPNRVGLTGALFPNSKIGINSNEETFAELLKKKDYKTGMVGKWHLGDSKQFLPLQHGFDEYLGIPYSNDMWPLGSNGKLSNNENGARTKLPFLPLIDGNVASKTFTTMDELSDLTTIYTERAVKFINENSKKPFLLYMAHTMVHVPLAVSSKFKGKSKQGLYGDVMMEVDWSVGEIMETLKKQGIEENTLVIFTSDNGPWITFGNHAGSAGNLREGKVTSWEGGQKVSCIMRWPETIPKGVENKALACAIDLLPTFAAITNTPLSGNKIDGVNILPLLKGGNVVVRDELLYYFKKNDLNAVRKGNWKLVFPHLYTTIIEKGKDGKAGKTMQDSTGLALYDLSLDPSEKFDVKDKNPLIVAKLEEVANRARADLGDGLTRKKGSNQREPGKLQETEK